jgi:hypothetical protein
LIARFSSGSAGSVASLLYAARIVLGSCEETGFGSNDGVLAMARIAPVDGSIATTAPCRLPRPLTAASCAARFSVSTTLPPRGSRPVSSADSRRVNSRLSLPDRKPFSACSIPVAP